MLTYKALFQDFGILYTINIYNIYIIYNILAGTTVENKGKLILLYTILYFISIVCLFALATL